MSDPSGGAHDPLEATLTHADDRVNQSDWTPPQSGTIPRVRVGETWYSLLWAIPIAAGLFGAGVLLAKGARRFPAVEEFIERHPGAPPQARKVRGGFPRWLRIQHFVNFFFMAFIIRAGIQILADHPRLYWNRDCTPGTEWFRFQHPVPKDRVWTAKDDSVTIPKWIGIPGIRHSVGLARWWHFSVNLVWVANGVLFYALLFLTDQWQRIVPTTWAVLPNALSTALQYLSLRLPIEETWLRYNSLQQLAYFVTVFVAAPVSILTGLMQGPAISNRLGWFGRALNRQVARSLHVITLGWFLFFIAAHTALVFITGFRKSTSMMFAGTNIASWSGPFLYTAAMSVVIVTWYLASPFTLRHSRLVMRIGEAIVGPLKALAERGSATSELTERDISPYFWPNGTMPNSEDYNALVRENFSSYTLRVDGLVDNPKTFSLAEIKAMDEQEQITTHFCIQGWTGVAKWGGVPMRHILDIVKPRPEARYVVFYSFADGGEGGRYYDVHKIENMHHKLTILAYEMNGAPVSVLHGAPLRLRCENELGFKMVKWISAIEFVDDFSHLGAGQGGYNEDHEFYGYRMPI